MVIVVVVVGIVSVVSVIAMVVGHRVADGRAADASDHSADWPAYNRSADCARYPAGDSAALGSQRR
jgi:hypothetical protein